MPEDLSPRNTPPLTDQGGGRVFSTKRLSFWTSATTRSGWSFSRTTPGISMPMRRNVKFDQTARENTTGIGDMSWFDEGKETLSQRVRQILTGIHWAEEPQSRVCHIVSNVQLLREEDDEVTTKSRFVVYRNRVETETDFFVGKRQDVLRKVDGAWKIASREITLDQNVLMAKNLTVFF